MTYHRVLSLSLLVFATQVALGTDFVWQVEKTGDQSWSGANWDAGGAPNSPLDSADLAVDLAADLRVTIGGPGAIVADLTLGGTGIPVSTSIQGSQLTLENPQFNAQVTSGGVSGSTNSIQSSLHLANERVEFSGNSTNHLTVGDVTFEGLSSFAQLHAGRPAGVGQQHPLGRPYG